jgi:hypothetical protein
MQANGAEMMRLGCMKATEEGLAICAPIHDALLLEAHVDEIGEHAGRLTAIMKEASEVLLGGGRTCGVEVTTFCYPDRYSDKRGRVMWDRMMRLMDGVEGAPGRNPSKYPGGIRPSVSFSSISPLLNSQSPA